MLAPIRKLVKKRGTAKVGEADTIAFCSSKCLSRHVFSGLEKGGVFLKRWFVIGFILLTCVGIVAYETNASNRIFFMPEPLGGMKVVIDPGHGGEDGGASKGDVIESKITLAISQKVVRQLKRRGAEVVMTRTKEGDAIAEHKKDVSFPTLRQRKREDLYLREEIVKSEKPDVFITIHANAIPETKWRGAQVFYHKEGHVESEALAKAIQQSIRDTVKNTEREALSIKQVYLLKKVEVPAVLVETGFLSNDEERALLTDEKYQEKMAKAIVEGVEEYYNTITE